jgi:hypothetical protein
MFHAIDSSLGFLPLAVRAGMYGLVVGAVAMLIYWKLSPQRRLAELKLAMAASRADMSGYDGTDLREVLRLSGRSIRLALVQCVLVLGPTLVAALPVIAAMAWIDLPGHAWPAGPEWLRTWHAPFMIGLSVAAIVMKLAFRIH